MKLKPLLSCFLALVFCGFGQAHAAITFFGKASNPADSAGATLTDTVPQSVTPPAGARTGDLVYLVALIRSSTETFSIANTGGQNWTAEPLQTVTGSGRLQVFHARFNGAWSANPSVVTSGRFGSAFTVAMLVFRPSNTANTWAVNVPQASGGFSEPVSPFNVTATGQTAVASNTVTIAVFAALDDNTWALQTSGWTSPGGTTQFRNTAGNDHSLSIAYKIQTAPGPTGNVVNRQTANGADAGRWLIQTFAEVPASGGGSGTPKHDIFQAALTSSKTYTNPFTDVNVTATFTAPSGKKLTAQGFHDGGTAWRVRIAPDEVGAWTYSTTASDTANTGLHGKTGTFNCIASSNKGFIRPDSTRKYSFSYSNGSGFFGVGDTAYGMVSGITDAQRMNYLNTRAAQKFNFIRFFVADAFRNSNLSTANAWAWGGTPSAPQYDRLNPQYFQRLEAILGELKARGLHAEIEVFNYYSQPFTNTSIWTAARRDLWARYVVSRLSAYSTVFLWTVTNEYETYPQGTYQYNNPTDDTWAKAMGALFHANDPHRHPTTVHNFSFDANGGIGGRFGNSADIDVLTQQKWGEATWTGQYLDGNASGIDQTLRVDRIYNKPVINTENGYEWLAGHADYNQQVVGTDKGRKAAWRVFAGGAAAYAAGFAGTWPGKDNFWWKSYGPLYFRVEDMGLARQITHYANFIAGTDFRNLSPAQSLVNAPNLCLANTGREYVVYAPSGGVVRLNLSAASGLLNVRWFNPRSGAYQGETQVQGGTTYSLSSPDTYDWVLHIRAAG